MTAIEILRAASRSVPNEDYVQFVAAVDALEELFASDKAYDDAKQAKFDAVAVAGLVQQRETNNAFQAARKRRIRAIARVGGA